MIRTLALALAVLLVSHTAAQPSKSLPTLPELVTPGNRFTILVDLLKLTDLLSTVVSAKDITIFAPTNSAFKRTARDLGCKDTRTTRATVACLQGLLVTNGNLDLVKSVLTYHVVPGARSATAVLRAHRLKTLQGAVIGQGYGLMKIDLAAGVPNARLQLGLVDLRYDNGVVHAVDRVLLPIQGLLLKARACSAVEHIVVTKLNAFVTLDRVEANALRCAAVRGAVRRCKNAPVCRRGVARRHIARKLTLGKVVSAVVSCKAAAQAIVKGC